MAEQGNLKVPRINPVDLGQLPKRLPRIEIDYTRCAIPMWCKTCLQECPHMIFTVYARKMDKYKENDIREPGFYEVLPVRRDKCTMCGKCVDSCPEGAITITYGDTVLKGTKKYDSVQAAKEADYYTFQTPRPYSYELSEEMLEKLRQEFDPARLVAGFAAKINGKPAGDIPGIAKEVFGSYGRAWMQKAHQMGEEFPDRTYEMLKEVIDRTGESFFPLVPQRFIEIAYLTNQQFLHLPIVENYARRLVYKVPGCEVFKLLKEQLGENIANSMPCKDVCLGGLATLFRELDVDASVTMDAETAKDGYCQFRISHA